MWLFVNFTTNNANLQVVEATLCLPILPPRNLRPNVNMEVKV